MGRPPLGSEGRTEKATLRITKQEERALVEVHGSTGKGLRALLDGWLKPSEREVAHAYGIGLAHEGQVVDVPAAVVDDPEVAAARALDEITAGLPPHRHRRKTKTATLFEQGSKVEVWACECGQEMR